MDCSFWLTFTWGKQFESELFSELSKLIIFWQVWMTLYHQQSNGLVKSMYGTLKKAIMAQKRNFASCTSQCIVRIMWYTKWFTFFHAFLQLQVLKYCFPKYWLAWQIMMNKWTILLQEDFKCWYQKWTSVMYLKNHILLIKLISLTNCGHVAKSELGLIMWQNL